MKKFSATDCRCSHHRIRGSADDFERSGCSRRRIRRLFRCDFEDVRATSQGKHLVIKDVDPDRAERARSKFLT